MSSRTNQVVLSVLFAVVFLSGCATTQFTRVTNERVELGRSTRQDVEAILGKPLQKSSIIQNGKNIDAISYAHVGVTLFANNPVKSQAFFFYENILVGHIFNSSWKEEETDFDESKVQEIKEGVTHIDEVLKLFGQPSGEQIYPLTENENSKAAAFFFYKIEKGWTKIKPHQKSLTVVYDSTTGIVSKVSFIEIKDEA